MSRARTRAAGGGYARVARLVGAEVVVGRLAVRVERLLPVAVALEELGDLDLDVRGGAEAAELAVQRDRVAHEHDRLGGVLALEARRRLERVERGLVHRAHARLQVRALGVALRRVLP